MKKLCILTLLFTAISFCFLSCSKDEVSGIINTTWTANDEGDGDVVVLKFISGNKVQLYWADSNLNISGSVYTGSYVIDGDNITFNLLGHSHWWWYAFDKGVISGNTMEVSRRYGNSSENDKLHSWVPITLIKK